MTDVSDGMLTGARERVRTSALPPSRSLPWAEGGWTPVATPSEPNVVPMLPFVVMVAGAAPVVVRQIASWWIVAACFRKETRIPWS